MIRGNKFDQLWLGDCSDIWVAARIPVIGYNSLPSSKHISCLSKVVLLLIPPPPPLHKPRQHASLQLLPASNQRHQTRIEPPQSPLGRFSTLPPTAVEFPHQPRTGRTLLSLPELTSMSRSARILERDLIIDGMS